MIGLDWLTWDLVRWINVALSSLVVVLLLIGTIYRWDTMPKRIQRISPWVICTYAIIAYGSGEIATTSDVDPGIRVTLMLLDLCGLLVALLYRFGDDSYDS